MTEIYLVRHGEAEGNLYRRMQGRYDGRLTELGEKQLPALAERFRDIHLDAVYSSDLCRAMETAAALCRPRNLPLFTEPRLREVNVGPWEDRTYGDALFTAPEQLGYFVTAPLRWHIPGADTYEGLANRAVAALQDIARANAGKAVAVCAHSYLIKTVLCKLFYGLDHPEQSGHSTNTAVSLLTWENGTFSLVYKNDASHLGPELRRVRTFTMDQEMNIRPMASDAVEEYIRYRTDAWQLIYGSLRGFDGSAFWLDAQKTVGEDPEAMVVGYLGNTPVGMIQLSPDRDAQKGVGYIPFLYLREAYRHRGLGIQLIGHAVSFYRKRGRTKLQLSVAPSNENALAFYHKFGFRQVKKQRGRFGYLLLMEKDIAPAKRPSGVKILPASY